MSVLFSRLQQEREEKAHQARLQRQREQQEIQRKRTEEERKLQAFMDDFDSGLLLDDKGQFKVTDSDVYSIIRRDDLNAIGNVSRKPLLENGPGSGIVTVRVGLSARPHLWRIS